MSDLTPLERSVLQKFLDGDESVLSILRDQFETVKVKNREFTGVGFFLTFQVSSEVCALPDKPSFSLDDVVATIPGLKMGAGFVLDVENGLLKMLEGYTYGDEAWPPAVSDFRVKYMFQNKRDIENLRKIIRSGA